MAKRTQKYDVLRGLAIILVLLIHISADYAYTDSASVQYWVLNALNKLFSIAVPTFVTLTVFLGLKSGKKRDGRYVLNKVFPLIVLYLLWSVFYTLFNHSAFKVPLPDSKKLILNNLLQGMSSYHLYYIVMLIQLYAVIAILSHLPVKRVQPALWKPLAAGLIQIAILIIFIITIVYKYWFFNTALLALFYLVPITYGLMLAANTEKTEAMFRQYWWVFILSIVVTAAARMLLYTFSKTLFGENGYATNTVADTIFWEIFIFGGVPLMFMLAERLKKSRALALLGRHSLGIYFAHPAVLMMTELKIKLDSIPVSNHDLAVLLRMGLNLVILLGLSFLFAAVSELLDLSRRKN